MRALMRIGVDQVNTTPASLGSSSHQQVEERAGFFVAEVELHARKPTSATAARSREKDESGHPQDGEETMRRRSLRVGQLRKLGLHEFGVRRRLRGPLMQRFYQAI